VVLPPKKLMTSSSDQHERFDMKGDDSAAIV
jgi:hypothetical protein